MMKKLLLTLALLFIPGTAWAQCTGVFPANTLCGNLTGTAQPPAAFSSAGLSLGPASSTSGFITTWANNLGTQLGSSSSISTSQTVTFTGPVITTSTATISGIGNFTSQFQVNGVRMQFPASADTVGGLGTNQTWTSVNTYSGPVTYTSTATFTGSVSLSGSLSLSTTGAVFSPALQVSNGGTGATTFTANQPLVGNGVSAVGVGLASGNTVKFATTQTVAGATNAGCAQFDASGNLATTGATCGTSGSTAPGGSDKQIQFNSSGAFGADAAFQFLYGVAGKAQLHIGSPAEFGALQLSNNVINAFLTIDPAFGFDVGQTFGATDGAVTLATLTANTTINLPDLGKFQTKAAGANLIGNGVLFTTSATASAAALTNNAGIFMDPRVGIGALTIQGNGTVGTAATIPCSGGAGGSPTCTQFNISFQNPSGYHVAGLAGGGAQQDLWVGAIRGSIQAQANGSFTPGNMGIAQIFMVDNVVSGGISKFGAITPGTSYATSTYTVLMGVAGHSQYGQQVWMTVTASGGGITSASILNPDLNNNSQITGLGIGFHSGDLLAPLVAFGSGTGFTIPVSVVTSNNIAAPTVIGQFAGSAIIWGIGEDSSDPNDGSTLRIGSTENGQTGWYNTTPVNLSLGGQLKFGTSTGTTHFPTAANGSLVCNENVFDNNGTLTVNVCNPVATLGAPTSGGTGYTSGSYAGVSMTPDWGSGSQCQNVTANIVVNSSGTVSTVTLVKPGTGCFVNDRLVPSAFTIGVSGSGAFTTVTSIATTPASMAALGYTANNIAGVSCAANSVSIATFVVTNGIVTHC